MWIIAFICVLPSIIDGKLGFGDQKQIGSNNDNLLESLNTFQYSLIIMQIQFLYDFIQKFVVCTQFTYKTFFFSFSEHTGNEGPEWKYWNDCHFLFKEAIDWKIKYKLDNINIIKKFDNVK